MKVIDQTPFRETDGSISVMGRTKGTLKYGPNWFTNLEGQAIAIAALNKHLGRGYFLLVNAPLPGTDDVRLPLVLTGPHGVLLLNVINERGLYRAKGSDWAVLKGKNYKPDSTNQLVYTAKLAGALQKYLGKQGFEGMFTVEPVLMAANPGMQIDSSRPVVRVVMSDALERFAATISQANAAITSDMAERIIERIITPRPPKGAPVPAAQIASQPIQQDSFSFPAEPKPSVQQKTATPKPASTSSVPKARPAPVKKTSKNSVGLTNKQLTLIGIIFSLVVICLVGLVVAAFFINA